ncbi:hypothetical protein [Legionella sp.]|uniref:hypothetical protein n=1 Tax=Legionella sp. TaxID=459 RepID=UPI003220736D
MTQEVGQSSRIVNRACLQTTGQRSTLTASYDQILAVLEGFSTPRSTDDLPKAQQTRLMQEASQQPNSLGCSAHTLFQPPNQHTNPMGPLAGEGRLLQQGDLLSRRWVEAYHVLEQALLDDDEFDQ